MRFHPATRCGRFFLLGALAAALHLVPAPTRADDPKFAYGKADDVAKLPPWAASVTAGFGMTTGNAQSVNFTGAGMVSHRFGDSDLLAFDATVAFQRSTVQTAVDVNGDGVITPDEVLNITQSVSEAWGTRLRYDHFFDPMNGVYGLILAGGDIPAGKQFVGSVQAGYSRRPLPDGHQRARRRGRPRLLVPAVRGGGPELDQLRRGPRLPGLPGEPDQGPLLQRQRRVPRQPERAEHPHRPRGRVRRQPGRREAGRDLEDLRRRKHGLPLPGALRLRTRAEAPAGRVLLGARLPAAGQPLGHLHGAGPGLQAACDPARIQGRRGARSGRAPFSASPVASAAASRQNIDSRIRRIP